VQECSQKSDIVRTRIDANAARLWRGSAILLMRSPGEKERGARFLAGAENVRAAGYVPKEGYVQFRDATK
jgi:hypothetical protein